MGWNNKSIYDFITIKEKGCKNIYNHIINNSDEFYFKLKKCYKNLSLYELFNCHIIWNNICQEPEIITVENNFKTYEEFTKDFDSFKSSFNNINVNIEIGYPDLFTRNKNKKIIFYINYHLPQDLMKTKEILHKKYGDFLYE